MSQKCADGGVPNYLSELINEIAQREGFNNYSVTYSAGSNKGDGFLGDLLRVKVTGEQNNVSSTMSLICKLTPADINQRIMYNTDVIFGREILMYSYVLPFLMQFQKECGVTEVDGFYSFPKCYGTILDEKPHGAHAIVLEDLLVENYYLWDKLHRIDYDRARMVLIELGKLHAVSFAMRDKNPEKLNEIRTKTFNNYHKSMYKEPSGMPFLNVNIKKAVNTLEPHEKDLIAKVEAVKGDKCFDVIDQVFSNITPEPFGVIVHGDMWNNNIFYRNDDKGQPSKLIFIDWQMSQFGSPTLDVAHYIFCSLDESIRSKHYHEFVDCYYNSLTQTLKKFGCDDQKLFTMTDLKHQFQTYGRTLLFAGPILCQIMTVQPADLPENVVPQWEEGADDAEMEESMNNIFGKLGELYKQRMSSLLRDGERESFI